MNERINKLPYIYIYIYSECKAGQVHSHIGHARGPARENQLAPSRYRGSSYQRPYDQTCTHSQVISLNALLSTNETACLFWGALLRTFPGRCWHNNPSKDICLWPSKVPPPKKKVSPPLEWDVNRSWLPLLPARPLCWVQRRPPVLTGVGTRG